MAAQALKASSLTGVPIEILLDILHHLDVSSVFTLAATSKFFLDLLKHRKSTILLPILQREFSPFDELLQVHTASAEDLDPQGSLYKPRRVVFKRFPGDRGLVLAGAAMPAQSNTPQGLNDFIEVVKGKRLAGHGATHSNTVFMTEADLGSILRRCRLVRRWEDLFPQIRWFHEPENCRFLRPLEGERFRRAFYRWWLYGLYFHDDLPRPRPGVPKPSLEDTRLSQLRYHSTSELAELLDLIQTMSDMVLHYICPRLEPGQAQSPEPLMEPESRLDSILEGWKGQGTWPRIVRTYVKLGPEELMYYFENIYSYPRKKLIADIRSKHPNLAADQESMHLAAICVITERGRVESMSKLWAEDSVGGIIDFDDARDAEREKFSRDGHVEGKLPHGARYSRDVSYYSPRGDDGSSIEDFGRHQQHQQQLFGGGAYIPFSVPEMVMH